MDINSDLDAFHQQVRAEQFSHIMLADDHRDEKHHGTNQDAWQIAHDYYEYLRGETAPAPRVVVLGYEIGSVISHQRDTVIEEIAQPMEQQGMPPAEMEPRCREILASHGLQDCPQTHPAQL